MVLQLLYKFFQTYGVHADLYSFLFFAATMKDVTNSNSNQPRSKSSVRRHGIVFDFQLPFWWAETNYKLFCTSCLVTQSIIKITNIKFCENSLGSLYSSVEITFSEVSDTVRNRSRHDVVAARRISERPDGLYFYFKNIYPFVITLKSSVTIFLERTKNDRRWVLIAYPTYPACLFIATPTSIK